MIEAWLYAVREHLRVTLPIPAGQHARNYIRVSPMGRPPAWQGQWFVGIDEQQVKSKELVQLHEQYWISIYVTVATGAIPADRYEEVYFGTTLKPLRDLERLIIDAVHNNHTIRQAADAYVTDQASPTAAQGFKQPLWYTGRGRTEFKGGDWINGQGNAPEGFAVRVLPFFGGIREQAMDVVT